MQSRLFKKNLKPWQLFVIGLLFFIVEYPFTKSSSGGIIATILFVLGFLFWIDAIVTKIKGPVAAKDKDLKD